MPTIIRYIKIIRWLPLLILLVTMGYFIYKGYYNYLDSTQVVKLHQYFLEWKNKNYTLALISFFGLYVIAIACSMPGIVILTMTAGFLFGQIIGTSGVVLSTTIGSAVVFISIQLSLGEYIIFSPSIKKFETFFYKKSFLYLVLIRLIPFIPLWAANVFLSLLKINFSTFIFSTFLGIMPLAFIHVAFGKAIGSYFIKDEVNSFLDISFIISLLTLLLIICICLFILFVKRNKFKK